MIGDWEQAYSRKDKKNKKKEEESPSKKNKKASKKADLINEAKQKEQEKPEVKDKTAKETENKELKEKEKKEVILTSISDEEITKAEEPQKEEQGKVYLYFIAFYIALKSFGLQSMKYLIEGWESREGREEIWKTEKE